MSLYIQNLKQIFQNLVLLYKHFIHWNLSKLLIFLYENLLGFILSLPFVGIILYQYFNIYAELGLASSKEEFILGNLGNILITTFLFLGIVMIFICTYTYGNFLMMNVYKSYLEGDKLPYTKNLYFSWKHFRAYIGILGWTSLYILAPILVGLVLIIPLGWLMKNTEGAVSVSFLIASFIIFIGLITWLFSVSIRLIFSSYGLLYSKEVTKAKSYTDESFRLTKGKVWKIIFLAFPFFFVLGIMGNILQTGEQKLMENRIYTTLLEVQKQSGQDDHQLLEGFLVERSVFSDDTENKEDFKKIKNEFNPMTNGINKDFLSASLYYIDTNYLDKNGWIFTSIFVFFSFFILEGLGSMLYLSIYKTLTPSDSKNLAQ